MGSFIGNTTILFYNIQYRAKNVKAVSLLASLFLFLYLFGLNTNAKAQCSVTATITRSSAAVCLNGASPTITFTGANGVAPYKFTYTLNNGTNQTITTISGNSVTLAVGTATAGTFDYKLVSVIDKNSCSKPQAGTASVKVNALPVATIAGSAIVCQNAPSPNISFTGASGTAPYTFTYSLNGGASQTISTAVGNSVNLAVPTTALGSFVYFLISVSDANGCSQSQTGGATITVSTVPTISLSSAAGTNSQTVCLNSPIIPITYAISNTATGAAISAGALPAGVTADYNAGVFTISGSPAAGGTFNYTVATTGGCTNPSLTGSIRINNVTAGTVAGNQAICPGGNPAGFTVPTAATGAAPLTYQWESNTTGCSDAFASIAGATSSTYDPPNGLAVTTYYRRVAYSSLNGLTCSANSNCVTVTINNVTPGIIATNQTVCSGGDPAAFSVPTAATGTGPLTYQWQRSTTDCNSGFSDIAGATSSLYDPPAGLLATTYYRRAAISTVNGNSCSSYSNCITVTINNLTGGTIGSDQTMCNGGDPSAFTNITAASGSSPVTYQWQSGTAGCTGAFSDIPGATSTVYDVPAGLGVTTSYRRVASATTNGSTCFANSNCVTVTVNNVSAGTMAGDQTICSGGNPAAFTDLVPASGVGTLSYQWQSNTTGCGGTFTNITGATTALYNVPAGLAVTTYYRRIVSSTINGNTCTAISGCLTVTINNVSGATITGTQTVCKGDNPAALTTTTLATGSATITYQWQSSTTDCTNGFSNIVGATSNTYDPPAGIAATTYYRCVATSTLNGVGCSANGNCVTVLVNDVSAGIVTGDQSICQGKNPSSFSVSTPASGAGTLSYQWQSSTTSCSAGFSNIAGATSSTYKPPSGATVTTYYHSIVTSILNGLSCTAVGNCITVAVNPYPAMTSATSATICSGDTLKIPLTSSTPSSYTWMANNNSKITGESTNAQTSDTINDILFNSSTTAQTVTYTVTPTSDAGNCQGASQTVTVTVNPIPTVSVAANYCYGGGKIQLTATSSLPSTYLWNTGETTQTILVDLAGGYNVTATAGGCPVTSYIQVAQELVVNGDFSAGNTGFTGSYGYVSNTVRNGMYPESRYTVNENPNFNHDNFWGRDHTSGNGKFMIVNGAGVSTTVVWQQTPTVLPNTTYYFAAWALSLNSVEPYAQLQFAINGVPFGTTAVLAARPNNNNPPYDWVRFYGTWYSGSSTSAQISIVDLQTAAGGNDFGLDDISFGTLTPAPLVVSGSGELCAGSTLNLAPVVTGGAGIITYDWKGPNGFTSSLPKPSIPNVTAANSGTYTLKLTDFYGCPIVADFVVKVNPNPTSTVVKTNNTCYGGAAGSINLTVAGGATPYTYIWSNGATTEDISELGAGTYTYTATDAVGCTTKGSVSITQPTQLTATTVVSPVKCIGTATGSVAITPSGGVGTYTITPAQTGLAAGAYTFTVKDGNNCSITVPVTVTEPPALTATAVVTNVLCYGASTGSVNISASGGAGGYTITPATTNLAAGNYTFTVKDKNSCSITVPVTVTQPAAPLAATAVATNVLCYGASTGSVAITATGGAGGYTITPAQTGLAAGNYTFTVKDINNCSITVPVTITQPAALTATAVATSVLCKGTATGSVAITYSGGVAPYTITPAQTGLAAGAYTFTVKDGNNCSVTVPVTITEPSALTATAVVSNVLCYGASTGSVNISASGGAGGYTITPATTGLAAGNYTFTVKDKNDCSISVPVTIAQPLAPLAATAVATNVLCYGASTGSVAITATGGAGGYTITPATTGLAAGNYTFTVKDKNNCSITVPVTISQSAAPLAATAVATNVLCYGASTGSVAITATGGAGGYTITPAQTGLAAGNYTFTVKDLNNCSITVPVTITQPAALTATAVATSVLCNGTATGSVAITHSGGVGPYTITPAQTGLAAGAYTFTVTDGNNCSVTVPVTITEPPVLAATAVVTNVLCYGASTGSVNISASGGAGTYTISPATTNLAAGNYTFTVKDKNNCSITVPVTITQPLAPLTATAVATNVLCYGASTGSVNISASGGAGTYIITPSTTNLAAGNYTFTVKDKNNCAITVPVTITQPAAPLAAMAVATNVLCYGASTGSVAITATGGAGGYTITPATTGLAAGNYTFTVKDINNCSITVPVTITQPAAPLAATAVATNVLCYGASTGSIAITATGGAGGYTISPATTGLAAGNYTFTVKDKNDCSISVPVTIAQPLAPLAATAVATNVLCYGASTGSVVITATGGAGNYIITPATTGLAAGNYTFTVKDKNNCSITVPVTISQPAAPLAATAVATNVLCYGTSTGSVAITATGGAGGYTITPAQTGLAAGNYTFTVKDINNCSITVPVTITQPAALTATAVATSVLCNGTATGSVAITHSGGVGPYTITPAQTGLAAGAYTFTVTDGNNCSVTVPVTITEPPVLAATAVVTNVLCYGASTGSVNISASGGAGTYTITPATTNLAAGNYTFTVKDKNNCSITVPVTITQPLAPLTATAVATNVLCYGASTGSVNISASGGAGTYTITPSTTNLAAGNYTFTVKDKNNCAITVPVTITQPAAPLAATAVATNVLCYGASTGSVAITPTGGAGGYTITPAQTGLAAGNYTFTVKDINNCSITVPVTITQPAAPLAATAVATNVLCYGASTGSVAITPTGGAGNYTITPATTGLAAGNYTFTVKDKNNCATTVPVTITQPAAPLAATAVATNVLCYGASTGSVAITATGGAGNYTITPATTGLAAGNYTFTVKDKNNCSITVPVTITQPPAALTATAVATSVLCKGTATGSVAITYSGGVGPYTITPAKTGLAAGAYTFTVTDGNNCSVTVPVTITEPPVLTATAVVTNVLCSGTSTGLVKITPAGGVGPYTITPEQTGLAAGAYTFTVTDFNNCSVTVPVTVSEANPIDATSVVADVKCNGETTGSIGLNVTGGIAPYTYTWSNGATTKNIGALAAGSYSVNITDVAGCSKQLSFIVSQPAPLTIAKTITNVTCNGVSTGGVAITPSGGVAPYTITPEPSGLAAGTYTFTVTDANNCSITVPITISEPASFTASKVVTNVKCYGESTGAVDLIIHGGTSPYTYLWSNGATTEDLSGLAAGTYTVSISDAAGCSISGVVTVTQPTKLIATEVTTNVTCNGGSNGSVVINASGGVKPYTITPAQTGLTAGAYTFTVTDANNCSVAVPVTISEPAALTATSDVTNVLCNGASTGSVVITASGGVGPYTVTPAQTGLAAGVYTFTVTDANNCSITVPVTISEPGVLTATSDITNVLCNGASTGAVVITASGGVGPYTITPAQTGLAAGSYSFRVTDANNCSITVPVTISEPPVLTATSDITNVLCNGASTGAVGITPSGGVGPYTISPAQTGLAAGAYTFTITDANNCSINVPVTITEPPALTATSDVTNILCNGASTGSVVITPSGGVRPYKITPAQTGLAAGAYTFTVTDANNCSITVPVTVTEATALTATSDVKNVLCNGASTGSVVITASGGVGPYTITPAQTGLAAGVYAFTVTDANNCSITVPVTITEPAALTATSDITNVLCNGASTGSVVITTSGGVGPYTITPAQTGLAAGSYIFTVTDANNCSITVPVTITEPAALTATSDITNVLCNGASTGAVVITPSGGVRPYTISPAQTGLAAGTYTFTVTDANNCSITVPVMITEPAPLTATSDITNILCNGASTGSVVITASGGAGPYTITPVQTGLAAGAYTFTVTDANNCSITVPVTITEPAALTATSDITNVLCNGASTGSVVITASGGVGPYTISPAQTGLAAGAYTFTVTDANNCSITVPVTISEPIALTATSDITNVLCNGASTGSVVITASGGVGPYTITPAQTGLAAGVYTFTVTDANNCSITVPVTISEPIALTATSDITNVLCNGASTGSVVITASGGVGPYTITPAQTGLAAGAYTFTVTDANNCSITVPVTITEATTLTATSNITNVLCNGASTGSVIITPSGGVGPYTISPAQTGLAAGSYTFTVTDANNCSITVPVTITEPAALTATSDITNVLCSGASSGSVIITPSGGVGPYTITPAQTNLAAGNYTFTVTDANNCSITVPVTITEPAALTATSDVTNVLCNGASTGSVVITPSGGVRPYTITPAQTGLAAGVYTFTVTDANNCSITVPVTITEPPALTATSDITNVLCSGASSGSVVITPSGGVGPYTITPSQTGLAAGSYTFTVTDANNCSINVPVTITEPAAITATTDITNVLCNGASTGSVVITPTGGVGPYTITPAQTGLAPGSYTFTVSDANNCSITVPVTITEATTLTATSDITNILCNGASTGSVVITPSGGVGPYTITPAQTGLAAGSYTFTVSDANNCSITLPVTITEATPLTATSDITNVLCSGASTGAVVITPSGGVGPYTITPAQTGLAAGVYTFTVTDANNCSITVPVTITEPAALTATSDITNILCNGASTGAVVITPSGGVGPYTITPAQTGLAAGVYTFTVTDANNCSITVPVTITEATPLTATSDITNVLCNGASTGSVVITPSGGVGPYTITPAQTGLAAGSYTFTVSDANNCSITVPVTITEPAALTATSDVTNVLCNGASTGAVVITASGGVGPYTISPAQTGLAAGTYTFTVTDANNCSITVPVTISEPEVLTATQVTTNTTCNGLSDGSVVITPTGGVGPYSITPVQTGLAAGSYTFTVTDANNCSVDVPVTITEPSVIAATAQVIDVKCYGTSTGSVVISPSGGTAPYVITPAQSGLAAGTYTFTITDANNCTGLVEVTISQPQPLISTTSTTICSNQLPFIFSGQSFTEAGTYSLTLNTLSGCDSIVTLVLTVNPTLISTTKITICSNQLPYSWNGKSYAEAGTYFETLVGESGCDSVATLVLTVNPTLTSITNTTICSNQLPYNWNGKSYAEAGTYSETLVGESGCDSVATLVLTVNPTLSSTTNITICSNRLPYSWNGKSYTEVGTYSETLVGESGCDSVATLVLAINPTLTSITNTTICSNQLPYNWNGKSYTEAGTYSETLLGESGCDSVATLVLTVNPTLTSITNTTICSNQLPYNWNGKSYTEAGTYSETLVGEFGCDSVATLVLTVNPTLTSITNTTVCSNQLPYNWNGKSYTEAGTYSETLLGQSGCDSVATFVLTVNPTLTSTTNTTVCSNQLPYIWNGRSYTEAGTYSETLVGESGCDSVATLLLTVNPTLTSTTNTIICSNQLPYNWNGKSYNEAGTYSETLLGESGCDSVATLVLTVNPTLTSTTNKTICSNQLPYVWNGKSYTEAGTYSETLVGESGCDSVATLVLAIHPTLTSTTNTMICSNQLPYNWNGKSYTEAGTYSETLVGESGCDSVATLVLTVNPTLTSTTNTTICSNQLPYNWNGKSYTEAGTYSETLLGESGCDSVATLVLTVNPTLTSTTNKTICSNQLPYVWNGKSYTEVGTYSETLVGESGCDSVATLVLAINPTLTSTTNATICSNQLPYNWNGKSYNEAGTYSETLLGESGCDSVATLVLTVNPTLTSTTNKTICSNQLPYVWNGKSYTEAGTYSETLVGESGCDSVATLVLAIHPTLTSTTNTMICSNQLPYNWNGKLFSEAGTYSETLTSTSGCDSVATLVLAVNATLTSTTNTTICNNQLPYIWNGKSYTDVGTYNETLTSTSGCDSIATLVLTVNPTLTSITNTTICSNQLPYNWNGKSYTEAGTYSETLTSTSGCDSVATLVLAVNATLTSTTNTTICNNQLPYIWNGKSYTDAGTYNETLTSTSGCDSIATLVLTVNPTLTSITNTTICSNQLPYNWNGKSYTEAGTYSETLVGESGCDSVATLVLTVNPTLTSTTNTTICSNQLPYVWNGKSYTDAGTYNETLTSTSGCDSIATLVLTVNSTLTSTTNITICTNQLPYNWNGKSYSEAGTYSETLISTSGCDSAATLVLAVNATLTSTTSTTICNNQLPYSWNGKSYNEAGTYSETLISTSGCDSVATLVLAVNTTLTSTTSTAICNNQLPYIWNGKSYNEAGTYSETLASTAGCDSVATLVLTINPALTSTTNTTICNNQLPYIWNGKSYNEAGTYSETLTGSSGCDSVATLVLTINPTLTSTTNTTICNNQLPYIWNGKSYNEAGTYSETLTSTSGCDSVATLVLLVNATLTSTTNTTICNNQLPYIWNGKSYTVPGTYNETLTSTSGCDSVATLVLAVNAMLTSTTNTTICNNQLPYIWNGKSYTEAGTYNETLTSTSGCDSIATLVLAVNSTLTSTTNITICNNQLPYVWNGKSYTEPGTYNKTLTSTSGCDSIATLLLTVNSTLTSTTSTTICNNQLPYNWNGKSYTAPGTYNETLTSTSGCDSIATLLLTVNSTLTSTTSTTICNNQLPYNWNGKSYSEGGTYSETLTSTSGCDSVATLVLTINPTLTSTTNTTICTNQLPYTWNGKSYTKAGTYNQTLIASAGCDSIATLVLTVNPTLTSTTNTTICTNQLPFTWNNKSYTEAGTYNETLIGTAGCDSIATLILTINPTLTSTTNTTICTNQLPYTWNNKSYTEAGTYNETLTAKAGCDSIATLVLTVTPTLTSTTRKTICTNQLPYTWNGKSYTQTGTYNETLVGAAGCDSIATLILTVGQTITSTINKTICDNQLPYTWNGKTYTGAGSFTTIFTNVAGCDSSETLILTVSPTITATTNRTICPNQLPYNWNGRTLNAAGTYDVTLKTTEGCDSVDILVLTVAPVLTSIVNKTICPGQLPFTSSTNRYLEAGTYRDTLTSSAGCDSVVTLILSVNSLLTSTTNLTICSDQLPYNWNGRTYNSGGSYSNTLSSEAGCDSIASLILLVKPIVNNTVNKTICSRQLPFTWSGRAYDKAGTYRTTMNNVAGCDSVVTLNLTVTNNLTETQDVTTCTSSYTLPDGTVATSSGVYTSLVNNTSGCDKMIITNLTIDKAPTLKINDPGAVCSPATINLTAPGVTAGSDADLTLKYWKDAAATIPVTNPAAVSTNGTYYISGTTAAGCTSIKQVNITVNEAPQFIVTNPTKVCAPDAVDLTATSVTAGSTPGLTFTYWKDAAATVPVENPNAVTVAGSYYIKATNTHGCGFSQSSKVVVNMEKPLAAVRYPTVMAAPNTPVRLQLRYYDNNNTFRWAPSTGLNSTTVKAPTFTYNKDVVYTVKITSAVGCVTVDTVPVAIQITPPALKSEIYVPKAWSPNNDGQNDILVPLTVNIREIKYFRIFNRWGQLVFETNEIGKGWNGIFKGKPQVADVYTWTLDATGLDDHHFNLVGNSILLK